MSHTQHQAPRHGYEERDARLAPVVWFTVGLAVLIVVVVFAMKAVFRTLEERAAAHDTAPHPMVVAGDPPPPRLQTSTADDLARHHERQRALTTEYAWIDPAAKTVRIPVERAMELVVERGLPARK
jgi:hypothetical protein